AGRPDSFRAPPPLAPSPFRESRSEEHTSELQSLTNLVCRLLLEKKKKNIKQIQKSRSNVTIPQRTDTTLSSAVGPSTCSVLPPFSSTSHLVCFFFFFFLMIGRPPSSTLFPYTPLFRSNPWGPSMSSSTTRAPAPPPYRWRTSST